MATFNFFSLLEDEESDASAVIERAAAVEKRESKKHHPPPPAAHPAPQQQAPAKLPSRPLPPAQAVKESKFAQFDSGRGRGGRGGGRGSFGIRDRERDGGFTRPVRDGGFQGDRDSYDNRNNSFNRDGNDFQGRRGGYYGRGGATSYGGYGNGPSIGEDVEGGQRFEGGRGRSRGRGRARGYGRGYGRGFGDVMDGEEPQQGRDYERRSGTGRGDDGGFLPSRNDFKRNGAGRGNWGIETEQDAPQETTDATAFEEEKQVTDVVEKQPNEVVEVQPAEEIKADTGTTEEKQDEKEDNEMLLDDYMKVLEEKRKTLKSLKPEGRKVVVDKDFEKMQLVRKKQDEGISVKPGSEKDKGKKKESLDWEDKAKKRVSINEFLRPPEGEEYYSAASRRGRGRGRGRGDRGGYRGGFGGSYNTTRQDLAPRIEDPGQFPILGAK